MGAAADFMDSFFSAYPEAKSGNLSMEELNKLVGEYRQKANSEALDDFDGLSPEQMTGLLYNPFATGTILQYRQGMETHVRKSPFFKLSEMLLLEIKKAGNLKLTEKGNLPVRICVMLCSQNLIYWPYMKYVKRIMEDEIPYLWPIKQYLLDAGIVKKRNNALSLTKNGEKLLAEPEASRFIQIFTYMANSFHWGNFYPLEDEGKCGQLGWAYSLLLLSKYGKEQQESQFYSLRLMRAFEKGLWNVQQKGQTNRDYHHTYQVRFFECFADWFGLVNIERETNHAISYFDQLRITKSPLFDQLFEVRLKK